MGADMAIAALAAPSGRQLAWAAADEAINDLSEEKIWLLADDFGYETDEEVLAGLRDAVETVRTSVVEGGNRECTSVVYGDTTIWLTGGMSMGDPPTDLFDAFNVLDASGVAEIIGFSWPAPAECPQPTTT